MTLSVDGLTFRYGSDGPLLSDITAEFSRGTITALTGPSGRGKSTLLYLLGLMLTPTGGVVRLDAKATTRLDERARAHLRATEFGFVFQDAALDSTRSVLENILETTLYRGASRRAERVRALDLMDEFGVRGRPHAKPGQISGGQAQRIALCRALLGRPRFLLADEPTGNLDDLSGRVVIDALRGQAESGAVVVVATHDARVIDHCDSVVAL